MRSIGAAIFVISMSLYPYVYLLARAAFRDQSSRTFEVSRALGAGPWRAFWLVSLPLARPAIAIGIALVMMEALNDFGAVEFFENENENFKMKHICKNDTLSIILMRTIP